jgi:hypothetical protein
VNPEPKKFRCLERSKSVPVKIPQVQPTYLFFQPSAHLFQIARARTSRICELPERSAIGFDFA